jgi:gamma-glutamylcysteine synthetase
MARKGLGTLLNGVEAEPKQLTNGDVVIAEPVTPNSPVVREIAALEGHSTYNKVVADITNLNGTLEVNRALLQVATNEIRNVDIKLEDAKNVLQDYKDAVDDVTKKVENANDTISSFIFKAKLEDKSVTELQDAHAKMLGDVTKEWNDFESAQKKWMQAHKDEVKAMIDSGEGTWLSGRVFGTCLCIFTLLLFFFAMTIIANITTIHSGMLTILLWTYGITMVAVLGIHYHFSRKT